VIQCRISLILNIKRFVADTPVIELPFTNDHCGVVMDSIVSTTSRLCFDSTSQIDLINFAEYEGIFKLSLIGFL